MVELGGIAPGTHRERDLHRWVGRQAWRELLPSSYEFLLPYTPDQLLATEVIHAALLPHEMFSALSRTPELFQELMTGPVGYLQSFWDETSSTRWFDRHPLPELHAAPHLCVPIGIHGDDAGVYNAEQVLVLTWCSVARELLTLDSRILFTAVLVNHCVPLKTVDVLYKVFRWSLNCLASGTFPHADHDGVECSVDHHPARFANAGMPLTHNNMRGVWSELRGDWKWQVECLHVDSWYNINCC